MPDSISGAAYLPTFKSNSDLTRDLSTQGLGVNGSHIINDTNVHAPTPRTYSILACVTACVISQIDGNYDGQNAAGITLPAGFIWYGEFTSVKLTSGTMIAYYKQQSMTL